jgi:hypothetical protein
MMKLLTMNVIPAIMISVVFAGLFSLLVGYISLRRSGIYFSILTLAFAQMSFALAYSVLTPITVVKRGYQLSLNDPRVLGVSPDRAGHHPAIPFVRHPDARLLRACGLGNWLFTFNAGYYLAASCHADRVLHLDPHLPLALRHDAARGKIQPATRMLYTGLNPRPYTLAAVSSSPACMPVWQAG